MCFSLTKFKQLILEDSQELYVVVKRYVRWFNWKFSCRSDSKIV